MTFEISRNRTRKLRLYPSYPWKAKAEAKCFECQVCLLLMPLQLLPRNTYMRNFQLQFVPKRERSNLAPGLHICPVVYQKCTYTEKNKPLTHRSSSSIFKLLNMNEGASYCSKIEIKIKQVCSFRGLRHTRQKKIVFRFQEPKKSAALNGIAIACFCHRPTVSTIVEHAKWE